MPPLVSRSSRDRYAPNNFSAIPCLHRDEGQLLGYKNVKHMSAGISVWKAAGEKMEKKIGKPVRIYSPVVTGRAMNAVFALRENQFEISHKGTKAQRGTYSQINPII